MKRILVVLAFISLIQLVNAQTGNVFPTITAEKLNGKKATLPEECKGKYTLIGLAYSQKSQDDLQTWFSPVYNTFIAKPENPLFDDSYDVNVYLIPMFTGANESAYGMAKNKLNKELDKELKPYVLLYKGDISEYKKALLMEERDKPYIFLLDGEGKVVYATSGAYTDEKLDAMENLISKEEEDDEG